MAAASALTFFLDCVFGRRRKLNNPRSVLLTFDDGPHPDVTPAVLDRLRTYQARALFFIVGSRIEKAPEMLNRILAEGHRIGNHSFEHRLEKDPRLISYYFDVRRCQSQLAQLTGTTPAFFLGHRWDVAAREPYSVRGCWV
jgi:peptidoglycan/xylan/chitin deacetylase (PgdA/CDA1 family)